MGSNTKALAILLTLAVFGASLCGGVVALATTLAPQLPRPAETPLSIQAHDIITMTNNYRISQHLPALELSDRLTASATAKAADLCRADYWHHNDSQGRSFTYLIIKASYTYSHVGENLAKGYDTPAAAFAALLASPEHHANIVSDYKETGVAFSSCGGKNYLVMHYGSL